MENKVHLFNPKHITITEMINQAAKTGDKLENKR